MSQSPERSEDEGPATQSADNNNETAQPSNDPTGDDMNQPRPDELGYDFEVKEQDRWLPIANGESCPALPTVMMRVVMVSSLLPVLPQPPSVAHEAPCYPCRLVICALAIPESLHDDECSCPSSTYNVAARFWSAGPSNQRLFCLPSDLHSTSRLRPTGRTDDTKHRHVISIPARIIIFTTSVEPSKAPESQEL